MPRFYTIALRKFGSLERCLDLSSQPFFVQVALSGGETTVSVL